MFSRFAIGLLLSIGFSFSLAADSKNLAANPAPLTAPSTGERCSTHKFNNSEFDYCVYPTTDTQNKNLIIHFHGLGGNAGTWKSADRHKLTRKELAAIGKSLPTVVTFSMGPLWVLTEIQARGDLYHMFLNQALPFLKNQAGFDSTKGELILMGESMGGYNALQFYFKNPELFSRVIVNCPAVANLTPDSSKQEINDYIQRTGAQRIRVEFFMRVARYNFQTPAEWEAHNPLKLIHRQMTANPPLYFSGSEHDAYGFFEGATLMNNLFSSKSMRYQWEPVDGGHCSINPKEVAKFL